MSSDTGVLAGRCWPDIAAAICRTKVSVTASDSFVTPHGRITVFSAVIRNRRCCWCSRTGVSLLTGTGELAGREAAKTVAGKLIWSGYCRSLYNTRQTEGSRRG